MDPPGQVNTRATLIFLEMMGPILGKTSTVIEAIVQLLKKCPGKRVLACAPSDAAADLLCSRLSNYFSKDVLFRLNWWQRLPDSLNPTSLISYCKTDSRGIFSIPDVTIMSSYRIVVSTCGSAGLLRHLGRYGTTLIPLFDLVVVDEVSQACEAEVYEKSRMCSNHR